MPCRASLVAILWSLALCAGAAPLAAADVGPARLSLSTSSAVAVEVPVGQSRVFTTDEDITDLAIGDPEVADIVLVSPRSFYVLGRGLGRTNLQIFSGGDFPAGLIDLEVTVDTADLSATLRAAAPEAAIDVQSVNGRLRLAGRVPDVVTQERVLGIAGQYGSDEVINALQIESPQQVFLQVRIVEASRDAARALGVSFNGSDGSAAVTTGGSAPTVPFGTFMATLIDEGFTLASVIEALETRGLARNLAEPTLAALSGETASFLAGGEVPIPVSNDEGDVTVEYKEFGVRLSFTPVVLGNGMINLALEPEVSQIDRSSSVNTGAVEVPGFSTRRASTTIELQDGQSFAIAGLLQRNNSRNQSQLPWLGNVPVLGTLFRSASYQREETDLVIIVTPHLSLPATGPTVLATPLDTTVPTSDATFFLYGKQEITRRELERQLRREGVDGPFGHVIPARERHVAN